MNRASMTKTSSRKVARPYSKNPKPNLKTMTSSNPTSPNEFIRKKIELKKRAWIFQWLREKIGLNALAMEVYKIRTQALESQQPKEDIEIDHKIGSCELLQGKSYCSCPKEAPKEWEDNDFYEVLPIIKCELTLDAKVARIKKIFDAHGKAEREAGYEEAKQMYGEENGWIRKVGLCALIIMITAWWITR